jgi:hypothetical protein
MADYGLIEHKQNKNTIINKITQYPSQYPNIALAIVEHYDTTNHIEKKHSFHVK